MAILKEFKGDASTWCPGCGDFGVMAALQKALVNLGLNPHEVVLVSGIGCSSKISEYVRCYGFHTLHGRSLPTAQGVKMANPALTVIAAGGDGDGYGIGLGHFQHAVRRNINITYLVMDNQIYGLTKGQTSPRSAHDFITHAAQKGNKEYPVDPLSSAIANGATFVAQSFSGDLQGLTSTIEMAIRHKGFSLVNIFSPCVTFNKVNTYDYFKANLQRVLQPLPTRSEAIQCVQDHSGLVTGVIYREEREDFQQQLAINWNLLNVQNGSMEVPLLRELEKQFQ